MGSCANGGGLLPQFLFGGCGCDRMSPAGVYVPGCPPSAEALVYGPQLLRRKIRRTGMIE